jgi:enoyl-CoA hydratase/carnithine racemase
MSHEVKDSTTDSGRVTTRRDGRILVITIDRPAKYNGFTPEMALQLAEAYTELERDPELWVGVLCAEGKHFTAGLDLPRWAELMKSGRTLTPPELIDPFDVGGRRRSKPLVSAVKGICFTAGIELMLAGDIVVASDDCRFSQLEVKRGIYPTGGATVRMPQRAGAGNALLYLLTGDEFDAPTALRLGFVQKVVRAGREFDEAMAIAGRIAAVAPLAVRETLRSVRLGIERGPDASIAEFVERQAILAASEDAAEGVRSFVERRPPNFSGQ